MKSFSLFQYGHKYTDFHYSIVTIFFILLYSFDIFRIDLSNGAIWLVWDWIVSQQLVLVVYDLYEVNKDETNNGDTAQSKDEKLWILMNGYKMIRGEIKLKIR